MYSIHLFLDTCSLEHPCPHWIAEPAALQYPFGALIAGDTEAMIGRGHHSLSLPRFKAHLFHPDQGSEENVAVLPARKADELAGLGLPGTGHTKCGVLGNEGQGGRQLCWAIQRGLPNGQCLGRGQDPAHIHCTLESREAHLALLQWGGRGNPEKPL